MEDVMREKSGKWVHYRTCNLCEAMCGLAIELEGEKITAIKGDPADPLSQGHICPKAVALQDIYHDPDRLRQPLKRTPAGWQPISWAEAYDLAAEKLKTIQQQYGNNAVGIYLGNPNVHNLGSQLFNTTLTRALRTQNVFSATSVDQLPHHVAARHMLGHQFLLPIPDIERTHYWLILGANPLASNGSLMTTGGAEWRLKAIQKRGGRVVVIDPRRTETAELADEHHFIRPGSDALFLLAMIHTILAEGLANPGRLAQFTTGLDQLEAIVQPYSPEVVSLKTGLPSATIQRLAREFAGAEAAVAYGRIGLSVQQFGGLCQWLINVLNIITGNFDRPGGAMFTTPALDIVDRPRAGKFGRWRSRVRGLPEFLGELPVSALAEEILTPGEGQIKALVTVAGNPVLSTPNGRQLDQTLAGLEFMVSIDIYLNETSRHAHLILPPTTGLETEHYDVVFHVLAVHNSAKYSPALYEPAEDSQHDWQIYRALAQRLGGLDLSHPMNQVTPSQVLDLGLQSGPYGGQGLSLAKLQAEPHGVDLGPLQPRLPERLFTADQKINLVPELFGQDLPRLQQWLQAETGEGLLLIGRRHLRSNNSWMHNSLRLVKGKNRCTVLMHPTTAANHQLEAGQQVTLISRVGEVTAELEITPNIMPGVVSLPHGWGHNRPGSQLQVAQAHAGVSLNDVTDEQKLDMLTGNAVLNGLVVQVRGV